MRVLVVNFEMDEDSAVLAWQARVVAELAGRVEHVAVLTERLGRVALPANVDVEQMPRRPLGIPRRLGSGFLVNPQVARLCRRHRVDACFVHMAHEWAYRLYPTLRLLGVPVLVWYAHGTVTRRLRLAHRCATAVVTSTPEGFRLPSRKLRVIGQGVDTDLFTAPDGGVTGDEVVFVGRVSRRKRVDRLLAMMDELRRLAPSSPIRLRIVGPPLNADDLAYDRELRGRAWDAGLDEWVTFAGFVPQRHVPALYERAFLHVNLSDTGSMDKTVVEALACGCPVLTSNPAFRELLAGHPEMTVAGDDPAATARRVLALHDRRAGYDRARLRSLVVGRHDVAAFAGRVAACLEEMAR